MKFNAILTVSVNGAYSSHFMIVHEICLKRISFLMSHQICRRRDSFNIQVMIECLAKVFVSLIVTPLRK